MFCLIIIMFPAHVAVDSFLAMFGLYYPLQYLSLSDVTVLMFLTPLCTALAGVVLLGENFRRREAFVGSRSLHSVVQIIP